MSKSADKSMLYHTKSFYKNAYKQVSKLGIYSICVLGIALTGCNNNQSELNDAKSNSSKPEIVVNGETDEAILKALETNLKASGIDQTFSAAVPTNMPDIYWVTGEGVPGFFTDKTGSYVIQGQIVEIGGDEPVDITAALMANQAKQTLDAVDKDELIIYPATSETKAVVYVFTDADCPYCTKLHSEMSDINDLGVEVRYLAWPRSEGSVPKMESIWCHDDRVSAMNKVKSGATIDSPACKSPVRDHMALGLRLGVTGTPAIYTAAGEKIGGYMPAKELAKMAIVN